MAADPLQGPVGDEVVTSHAPAAWDRMVRSLSRELPRGLKRSRDIRKVLRRRR
jgi:hypothetical protein